MMVGITDDVLTGSNEDKCTVMMFLDLSAAFDTIDIDKLVQILEEEIGLAGTALQWCKSFLTDRTQRVKIYVDSPTLPFYSTYKGRNNE